MSAVADPGRAGERTIYSSHASGRRIPRGPDNAQCARFIPPSEPSSPFRGAGPVRADVLMTARWRSSPMSGRGIESRRDGSALASGGWPWRCRSRPWPPGNLVERFQPGKACGRRSPSRPGETPDAAELARRWPGSAPMRGISHGARRRPQPLGAGIRPVKTAAPSGPERVPNTGWPRRASDTAAESPRHAGRAGAIGLARRRALSTADRPSGDNRRHGPESVNRRRPRFAGPARTGARFGSVGRNRRRSIFIRLGVFRARRACTGGADNHTPLHLTAGEAMAFPEAQGRR
jgi:hypothetical protein